MPWDFWNKAPFLRLLVPLIAGVVVEIHTSLSAFWMVSVFAFLCAGFVVWANWGRARYSRIFGALGFATVFFAGFLLAWFNRSQHYNTHFSNFSGEREAYFTGTIYEPPQEKARSVKSFVSISSIRVGEQQWTVQGNLLLYLEKSDKALSLRYGDRVSFRTTAQRVEPPANPLQFNFKEYLENNDIYHQAYVKSHAWRLVSHHNGNPVKQAAYDVRQSLLQILETHLTDQQHLAVGAALILGYKDHLDPDILRSFSSAGAMHVLAVSGLHVGIVFLLLNTLLKPISERGRYGPWIRAVILLLGLWSYAFITGLSPSVQRAATMFSFIVIGAATSRPTNVYNTLCASAFLLILIDPLIITKVGFQLSYLAVIGIVYIQPKLYNKVHFKYWLPDKIWAITCVSCAAQLATFPLGLYYFHQFPNYFFISNLVVIPMATFILYGGMLLLASSAVGWEEPFAWALRGFLDFLNESVVFVEQIPWALMYGNDIGLTETLLLYVAIFLGLAALASRHKRVFWGFAGVVLVLLTISSLARYENGRQSRLVVYSVPDQSVINFMSGGHNYLVADSSFLYDESQQLYYVKHFWYKKGFVEADPVPITLDHHSTSLVKHQGCIAFAGHHFFRLSDPEALTCLRKEVDVEVLILSGDHYFDLDRIATGIRFEQVVIDSSVPKKTARIVTKLARKRGWRAHNVHTDGAFIMELEG